jgi:heme/copper-type cytochrome/quinol oxidase subunit 2
MAAAPGICVKSATSWRISPSNACGADAMSAGIFWLVMSLLVAVGLIGALFLSGWRHRKDRMPQVPPLPPEEDDWRK